MRGWQLLCGALLLLAACRQGDGAVRGEGMECTDQSQCEPYHLVCAAPPGFAEGDAATGICVRAIPPGSCAFYVREGVAQGRFCAD